MYSEVIPNMLDIDTNIALLLERVASNSDCRNVLAKLRWADGFVCPECNHEKAYVLKNRPIFQCAKCKKQTSPTAGTVFHGLHSLVSFFHGLADIANGKNSSAASFAREENLHYSSAWEQLQKIRTVLESQTRSEDSVEVACSLLHSALFKPSSETPFEIESPISKDDRIVSVTLMPATEDTITSVSDDLMKALIAFLLSIFRGVSRKYAQKYIAQFSWLLKKRHVDFLGLLTICIRGKPIHQQSIYDYRSPFMVRIVRTTSINFPLVCTI